MGNIGLNGGTQERRLEATETLFLRNLAEYLLCGNHRLCGLVVRVPGCRPRGPGFDYRRHQIF
jgi:hypothetical protein